MNGIAQDIRYALRAMKRQPAFFAFAAVIVGLGVGATTSVFSVMSPLLLRSLPFEDPDRLAWVANNPEGGLSLVTSRTSNLRDFREMNQSFESMTGFFAFFEYESYNLTGASQPERLVGVGVAQDFLEVLGVQAGIGRNFTYEEGLWGGPPAAILSYGFWLRRFGADPNIVGQSITLNGTSTPVVGVLPPTFDFASTFAPASRIDFLRPFPISDETDQSGNTLSIIGRLAPGVTILQAQSDLDGILRRLQEADPARWGLGATVSGLREHIAGSFRGPMVLLAAAAGVVLLVACANLSNLLLARGHARRKELAVRSALGAGRRRLIRQLTVESLTLASLGGMVGVVIAYGVTRVVANTTAVKIPMLSAASVDTTVLAFTVITTMVVGLLIGLVPALQFSRANEATVINDASRGSTEGRRSTALREMLVVGEVALALVLLVGGGLLLRSFLQVLDVDLGFQPHGVVAWEVEATRDYENRIERTAFYKDVAGQVAALPGIDAVSFTDTPPLGRNRSWGVRVLGVEYPDGNPSAFPRVVDWHYLDLMGIPLTAGRQFTADDLDETARVVILNEYAADALFPGQNPVGQIIVTIGRELEVVGIAGDVRHQSLEQDSGLEMYLPMTQIGYGALVMVVQSSLPIGSLVRSVGATLETADPMMPNDDFWAMNSVVDRSVSPRRFILLLVGAFAGSALLLAALGIYAVLSFSVSQRIPEIGIRMALGESAGDVLRRVVGRTLLLAGIGVAVGAAASLVVSRMMQSLLFGIGSTDVTTFAAMATLLLGVSALAGFLPARRASGTDPIEALRAE